VHLLLVMVVVQELGAPSKKLAEETGATDKPDHALDESLDDLKYDAHFSCFVY